MQPSCSALSLLDAKPTAEVSKLPHLKKREKFHAVNKVAAASS